MTKKIDLNKLSYEELKKKIEELEQQKKKVETKKVGVWQVGKSYVVRTVTMIQVGRLINVTEKELVMEDCAWVADTGRWMDFLKNGKVNEVEPFQDEVIIGRDSIIDATVWNHNLLRDQK